MCVLLIIVGAWPNCDFTAPFDAVLSATQPEGTRGNQREPKGVRREPKGTKREPEGTKTDQMGAHRMTNRSQGGHMGPPRVQSWSPKGPRKRNIEKVTNTNHKRSKC